MSPRDTEPAVTARSGGLCIPNRTQPTAVTVVPCVLVSVLKLEYVLNRVAAAHHPVSVIVHDNVGIARG